MAHKPGLRKFQDAVAIVTGAASGIGRALAEEFSAKGAEVVLADMQLEMAEAAAEGIREQGGKASAVLLDVSDTEAVNALVEQTWQRCGRLDFMINNAGIGVGGDTSAYTQDDWEKLINVNIRGVVNGVQAVYKRMIEQGFGHIVNTASMAGLGPAPLAVGYSMTKHAVVGLSTSLRAEAALEGIRVSVICPGVIRTAILDGGKYGKMVGIDKDTMLKQWDLLRPMRADKFARKTLKAVKRNKPIIIFPWFWRLIWLSTRLTPRFNLWVLKLIVKRGRKKLGIK